jgi:hypothetical protein
LRDKVEEGGRKRKKRKRGEIAERQTCGSSLEVSWMVFSLTSWFFLQQILENIGGNINIDKFN